SRAPELGRTRLRTVSREADRQELPVPLRRDVRLLGDLLGEVIREAGGQDLLDDVERLRRAVIAARDKPPGDEADLAGDQIAALVAGWPLARAELVAKAFTIYFHLTNLAEERHRVRTLRGHADLAPGLGPRREALAAALFSLAPAFYRALDQACRGLPGQRGVRGVAPPSQPGQGPRDGVAGGAGQRGVRGVAPPSQQGASGEPAPLVTACLRFGS